MSTDANATAKAESASSAATNAGADSVKPWCDHHMSFGAVYCDTCKDYFPCSYCHDLLKNVVEVAGHHKLPRDLMDKVKCKRCDHITSLPAADCSNCKKLFAEYFCKDCRMYDSRPGWKKNYHCNGCKSCRIGVKEGGDFGMFHCERCKGCLPLKARPAPDGIGHTCFENSYASATCAFCCGSLSESRKAVQLLSCGHAFHSVCIETCLNGKDSGDCLFCRNKTMFPVRSKTMKEEEDGFFAVPKPTRTA